MERRPGVICIGRQETRMCALSAPTGPGIGGVSYNMSQGDADVVAV